MRISILKVQVFPFIVKLPIVAFSLTFSDVEPAFFEPLMLLLLKNLMSIDNDFPEILFWCSLPAAWEVKANIPMREKLKVFLQRKHLASVGFVVLQIPFEYYLWDYHSSWKIDTIAFLLILFLFLLRNHPQFSQ